MASPAGNNEQNSNGERGGHPRRKYRWKTAGSLNAKRKEKKVLGGGGGG